MLWKLRRTDGSVSMLFLLSDRRGKRALDAIFEHGHTKLARVTRPSASDLDLAEVRKAAEDGDEQCVAALDCAPRVLELLERQLHGVADDAAPPRRDRSWRSLLRGALTVLVGEQSAIEVRSKFVRRQLLQSWLTNRFKGASRIEVSPDANTYRN